MPPVHPNPISLPNSGFKDPASRTCLCSRHKAVVPWHGQDSCSTSEGVLECTPCSINYMFYIKYLHLYLWHNGSLHVPEKARFTSTESLTHSPPVKMPDRSQPASSTALAIAPFLSSSRVRHKKQKTRPCQHLLQELVPSWGMDVLPFSV